MRVLSLESRITSGEASCSDDFEAELECDVEAVGTSGSLSVWVCFNSFETGAGILNGNLCCVVPLLDGVRALRRMDLGLGIGSGLRNGTADDDNDSSYFGFLTSVTTSSSAGSISETETRKQLLK
jgi:hypothetical protein